MARQITVSIAAHPNAGSIERLMLADLTASVDSNALGQALGIQVDSLDLAAAANIEPELVSDTAETAGFAIAYGSAIGQLTKAHPPDFRADFAPYQGKKVLFEKALKVFSISATILMLSIGLYFQLRIVTATGIEPHSAKSSAASTAPLCRAKK